jgi:hypothetical protein
MQTLTSYVAGTLTLPVTAIKDANWDDRNRVPLCGSSENLRLQWRKLGATQTAEPLSVHASDDSCQLSVCHAQVNECGRSKIGRQQRRRSLKATGNAMNASIHIPFTTARVCALAMLGAAWSVCPIDADARPFTRKHRSLRRWKPKESRKLRDLTQANALECIQLSCASPSRAMREISPPASRSFQVPCLPAFRARLASRFRISHVGLVTALERRHPRRVVAASTRSFKTGEGRVRVAATSSTPL